ncbi:Hypothetical protein, putative [Bodo saltans]|uniref:Secreted protein n=1 Tax=Bodo saltans TaxID=75058 RepID=A0A0S4J801_BODSA|nr:Hypothetical protein, putative [Bodo saltans]|eukprot:CUG79609.1 Hypothetical protein, putative [Bodo saltans]
MLITMVPLLCFAAYCGHVKVIEAIFCYGKNVDAVHGFAALHCSQQPKEIMLPQLTHSSNVIGRGANVAASCHRGSTALQFSPQGNHTFLVKLFTQSTRNIDPKE